MDTTEFDEFMRRASKAASDAGLIRPDGTPFSQPPAEEPALGDPSGLDAITGGGLKSTFETKDFLFGETPPEQRGEFRQSVEATVGLRQEQSLVDGFAAGVGQFAVSMIGLGKATDAAKLAPWFGKGVGYLATALPNTVEVGKAALAGAIGFDPHEERLSNLIQSTPLANPVNEWLAADPSDTAAEGRVKAAMESIGMDAAILGTFMGATKVWKALRSGKADEASRLVDQMKAEQSGQIAASDVADEPLRVDAPSGAIESHTRAMAGDESTTRVAQQGEPVSPGESSQGIPAESAPPPPEVTVPPEQSTGATTDYAVPRIALSDEDTAGLLKGMEADADAITNAGGWYQAIAAGHTFGRGEGIPYNKLAMDSDLDDFMARVVDSSEERLNALKGGPVLTDATVDKTVRQMADLFNADPARLLGMVQTAGADAANLVANMEAGYLVSNRMFQDSFALASRIRLGDYSAYGSRDAAMAALKHHLSVATSVYGAARSMTAASGRAMRRMRMDFSLDPATVNALGAMDAERMVRLIGETQGNPRALGKLIGEPTLWAKTKDFGSFLLINGLVSSPKTQLINALSNGYMVMARPLERIVGAVPAVLGGNVEAGPILKQSLRQYTYLGSAFTDAFETAKRAFAENDSILAPHATEAYAGNRGAVRSLGAFKPWDSPGNILHNALLAAVPVVGLPTRTLGFIDELSKQTVYRATVLARAHESAVEAAQAAGLSGKAFKDYVRAAVRNKLDDAFDAEGRGTDEAALREAQTATFQQELAPNSMGKWLQTGAGNFFPLRLMLPFVKTPTNILRYGWKMTPGLNMLQTEFRDAITGKMGMQAKMQATGQMMLGGLFMGSAAFLVSRGTITGGGPKDPKLRSELMATGWQPYSVVHENEDGTKTYLPFGRVDPVAMPFGIMADLMDALHVYDGEETPDLGATIGGLLVALSRQFTSKSYLDGVSQALDALSDPDSRMESYAGRTLANFIPFSAALRQLNPDPYLRDARDITDKLLATIPGYSEGVAPRRDAWGDPVRRVGLWSSDEDQTVDRETQRLILESGGGVASPQPVHNGVDLRDVTMSDGMNAYEKYQLYAGHPPGGPSLKSLVAKLMASKTYLLAPDGDVGTKGTKLWLLHTPVGAYRERALKMLKRDPVIRDAFRAEDLKARQKFLENRAKAKSLEKVGKAFGVDLSGN